MSDRIFNFEINANALRMISRAFDWYVEKWPGGAPEEQEMLKQIQLGLHKALLDLQLVDDLG